MAVVLARARSRLGKLLDGLQGRVAAQVNCETGV